MAERSEKQKESIKKAIARSAEISHENKRILIFEYEKNPKYCFQCGKILSFEQRKLVFCGRSCSVRNSNIARGSRTEGEKRKQAESLRRYHLQNPQKKRFEWVCQYCGRSILLTKSDFQRRKTCGDQKCNNEHLSIVGKEQIASGKRVNTWGGRCKKIEYNGMKLDGSFELEFVKWCERNNVDVKRNRVGFKYFRSDGSDHTYFPDFSIGDELFVECKGYETDIDKSKWNQFPFPLVILRKKQIKMIKANKISKIEELKNFLYVS